MGFAFTPTFLNWTTTVRPNTLELFLIFATLFACIRLIEGFSYRTFLIAAVLGALTFSTKYGGWPFVGLLPALALYVIWRSQHTGRGWTNVAERQVRLFRRAVPFLVIGVAVLGGGLGWLLFTNSGDTVALVLDVSAKGFPPDKLERAPEYLNAWSWLLDVVAFGGLLVCAILIGVLIAVWRFSRRWTSAETIQSNVALYIFLAGWLVAQVLLIYAIVFFASGPVYLAHPEYLVSQGGYMVYYTALGGGSGQSELPGFLESFRIFATRFHPGWIGFVALLAYAAYREFWGKHLTDTRRTQRLFLWLFAAIIIVMVLVTRQTAIRHVLSALGILYLLVAAAIIPNLNVFHKPNTWRIVRSGAVPVLALVGVLVVFHASEASGDWDYKMSKPLDTGLEVGDWLQERYPEDVRIMTDWDTFYIPPYFVQTSSVTPFERKERRDAYKAGAVRDVIVSFDPDVIAISHPQGFYEFVNVLPLLTSDPVIESRDYKLVKQFDYDRADRQRYGYEHVLVYEKGSLSSRLSKRPAE